MGLAERFAREDAEAEAMRNGRPKHARPATKVDETPEFVEFWKIWQAVKSEYEGRGLARDAFFRHVWWKGADASDIVDGARYYVQRFKTGQFRMKSDQWMERGLYEDDAEKWRAYQQRLEESRSKQEAPADRANVVNFQPETKQPDSRPSEEERTRFARDLLARAGLAAQG